MTLATSSVLLCRPRLLPAALLGAVLAAALHPGPAFCGSFLVQFAMATTAAELAASVETPRSPPGTQNAGTAPPAGKAAANPAVADTLADGGEIPVLVVGSNRARTAEPDRVSLGEVVIGPRDAWSVAELGFLLPATQVNVNSRGESLLMIRNAPERHVTVFLDGIPLNVPWDERVDLSMVPADAIARLEASRGVGSVLDGPNTLAGSVNLVPPTRQYNGQQTHCGFQLGEGAFAEGRLLHQRRHGDWQLLAALAHRQQDGFQVPANLEAPFHQAGNLRTNSDLKQTSALVRLARKLGDNGSWRLLLAGTDGDKGVPPETHLASEARFWRYPLLHRGILGFGLDLPLGGPRKWELAASAGVDYYRQQIRQYDDSTYSGPALLPGTPFEDDKDGTGTARIRATRHWGTSAKVSLMTVARYTQHREVLEISGPQTSYAQWLLSSVVEADWDMGADWDLRGGLGYEFASTPETGDKPPRDPTDAAVGLVRLTWQPLSKTALHASASRRSRFPSLRELYSGALGRFVPNPDLMPERQDLLEVGGVFRNEWWNVGLAGFASFLADGIERVVLSNGEDQFQRINVSRIRTLGLEFVTSLRSARGVSLTGHYSLLHTRRQEEGSYTEPVEDRPDYLTSWTLAWIHGSGLQLLTEITAVGARFSADLTDEEDGFRRLPAQATWNLRLGYFLYDLARGWPRTEIFLRLNNVTDVQVDAQLGLPGPGRVLMAGIKGWLGE